MAQRVALTFDVEHADRPTRPGVVETVLDTLDGAGITVTFFMQGRWVEAYPRLARRIADADHVIGNHSHYHARMPLLSDRGFKRDVASAERVIRKATGHDPRPWFRSPFGAGTDHARTHELLADLGYREVNWNVETGDWRVKIHGPQLARETVAKIRAAGDGAIVLMHGWPVATARALPLIVEQLAGDRARFVGVDALIGA